MSSRNEQILKPFKTLVTWEQKYKKIIEWGQQLEPFAEEDKIDKWLIKACQSPLWLKLGSGPKGELIFTGDSSALISKGLLALIIEFYTGRQALEILQDQPDFIKKLDLAQYLSSRRTNGLPGYFGSNPQLRPSFFKNFKIWLIDDYFIRIKPRLWGSKSSGKIVWLL